MWITSQYVKKNKKHLEEIHFGRALKEGEVVTNGMAVRIKNIRWIEVVSGDGQPDETADRNWFFKKFLRALVLHKADCTNKARYRMMDLFPPVNSVYLLKAIYRKQTKQIKISLSTHCPSSYSPPPFTCFILQENPFKDCSLIPLFSVSLKSTLSGTCPITPSKLLRSKSSIISILLSPMENSQSSFYLT